MKATVNTRIFTDLQQKSKAFKKGDEWSGTKERFAEINANLEKKHGIKNALIALEEEVKERKPKTETKERKLKTETK